MLFTKPTMVDPRVALRGRDTPILRHPFFHRVFGHPVDRVPEGAEVAILGLGCFWGAEKLYWNTPGVLNTAAGYAGGYTPNPTYEEACSGRTGHAEVVKVVYDPAKLSYEDVLRIFFENHDPTQGFRQGNDRGTQYRSAIYTLNDDQARRATAVRDAFAPEFAASGFGPITTEIAPADAFYYAEDYHQQYLEANPFGYCPVHATGVTCNPGSTAG
ncbi:MAG TPA: peptide-methionine (S)-S-oxide reductase MsrA [Micropruina sp.]|nr:peptide-methionine (S)-S-oxide reductase MsrA [Micropruina sp.]HMR20517.1 peptide-methionine (S)-S-oxide reductase MsrA [Micropruina sp.]